jgi:hypothetical protein
MNNEPAFPVPSYVNADGETHDVLFQGMTLRDYFAAKAMQGFQGEWVYDNSDEIASKAYALADAMLKAREA